MSNKKKELKDKIMEFINCVLNTAEVTENIDYIEISINNHKGNLQMDYTFRDRKKIY